MSLTYQYPVIVSASRRTDIPAFFAEKFMQDIKKGFTEWTNPFNQQQKQIISFEKTRLIVFWTKNPLPLIPHLSVLDKKNIGYYFLYTLNDYEQEGFEPAVPSLQSRIKTFKTLSGLIGKEKVHWRFDPFIITPSLSINTLYEKTAGLYDILKEYTVKLIISFADFHYKRASVMKKKFSAAEWTDTLKIRMAEKLQALEGLKIFSCAESLDLSQYGIEHNKCIDDVFIKKTFAEDTELLSYAEKAGKDKNQRPACLCISAKDIGTYRTCRYQCVYCYAL